MAVQGVAVADPGLGRRRVLAAVLPYAATLIVLVSLNFFLPRALPGDPLTSMQDPGSPNFVADQLVRQQLRAYYGLDQPLVAQFGGYLAHLVRGDLGISIRYNEPVAQVIGERLPWTLLLVVTALLISAGAGLLGGIHSAWRRGKASDRTLLAFFLGVRNLPSFFVGYILLLVFSVWLGWFPLSGAQTPFSDLSGLAAVPDIARHLALPAITLALSLIGADYLLMRNSMVAELGQEYMLLGRAKGLKPRRLKYRYAARNALLPVVTQTALQVAVVVTTTVFVETVFAYPGLGRLVSDAVAYRDYPLLEGTFLFFTVVVLLANLAVDLLYIRLDPRTAAQ